MFPERVFSINCSRNFLRKKFDKIIETFPLLCWNKIYPCKTWESVHQSGLSDTVTIIHLKTRFAYRLFAKRKKKRKEQKTEREKERGVRNLFLSNESRLLLEIYYRSLVTMNSFVAGSIERQSRDLPSKETASYNHVGFH